MVKIYIPEQIVILSAGKNSIDVIADDIQDALSKVFSKYPLLKEIILSNKDNIFEYCIISLNGQQIIENNLKELTGYKLTKNDIIRLIIPAAGG